jgi:serine/threonine-protein kinase
MDSLTLVKQIRDLGLWPEDDAARHAVLDLGGRLPDARLLARELLQRDLLTAYQANQLLAGKGEGLVVGGYHILERLGEGGMGQVFKARQPRLYRPVALKVIRPEHVTSAVAVERFLREIRAAALLAHPNVVRAYDAGRTENTYFYAMQLLEGRNLSRLVEKEGPLALERACDYALQAALGLGHIHEHGLVHRDVKPSNLMVTRPPAPGQVGPAAGASAASGLPAGPWGQVKILDLGTARLCDEPEEAGGKKQALTKLGAIMGTADYMAPEQAISSRHADIRSDLYSLGCTLYLMLTGRPPFPGGTALEKIMRHQLDEPAPVEGLRPGVPPDLLAVVRRLMAKQPAERFQTPAELAEALLAVSETIRPVEAIPVAPGGDGLAAPAFRLEAVSGGAAPSVVKARPGGGQPDWATAAWIAGGAGAGLLMLGLLLKLLL